jgi:hypothetical protein
MKKYKSKRLSEGPRAADEDVRAGCSRAKSGHERFREWMEARFPHPGSASQGKLFAWQRAKKQSFRGAAKDSP